MIAAPVFITVQPIKPVNDVWAKLLHVFNYNMTNFLLSFHGYLLFQIILHDRIIFTG